MPHFIIEYSSELNLTNDEIGQVITKTHSAALNSNLFDEKAIKVRAYPCANSLVAGEKANFMHITARLIAGRDNEQKKRLTEAVLSAVKTARLPLKSLSVETCDIHKESYSKETW